MGYVFDYKDAKAYEQWCFRPRNQYAAALERELLLDLLKPMQGKTVLDIGCGTGASLVPLLEQGLRATGLDPSSHMLDIAEKNLGNRVDFHCGFAEDLPFDDNSFNYACLITALEFVEDPKKAIEEACRVAKDRIFIGVLNSYAIKGLQLRIQGVFSQSIFNRARFFSIWELKQIIRSLLGDVPVSWRTTAQFPPASGKIARRIDRSKIIQRCPFGTFAGMVVVLAPRFRTRPLPITYGAEQRTRTVTG